MPSLDCNCIYDKSETPIILRSKKKGPRKDPRKGSENRRPSGLRERNVAHPDGEEHSRVPKGNGLIRRIDAGITIAAVIVVSVILISDDMTGAGVADDALLPVLGKVFWDACTTFA